MNPLAKLVALPEDEKSARGLLHTPHEIAQQPAVWPLTFACFRERLHELKTFLSAAGIHAPAASSPIVYLVGAGTSDYIGRSLASLLRRQWQCEVVAVPSTDLLTHIDDFVLPERPYLWISFSRSGDSPEGVAVIEKALDRHPGIYHLVVSCNSQARMLKLVAGRKHALGVALPDRANDRGLAMTGAFTNMLIFGQCLAHIDQPDRYRLILDQLVESADQFLEAAAKCAQDLSGRSFRKACFVGSGALKGIAKEAALKVLELTSGKMQTMSESALGLRHGPMAALDQETLFVSFLSSVETVQKYEADLLQEIGKKELVQTRVAVCGKSHFELIPAEHILNHSTVLSDDYRPPLDVIFGQLLGLFFSLRHGLKPDCPSPNGAISRVVQNVLIHS